MSPVMLIALVATSSCAHVPDEPFPDESVCVREAELRGAECATVYQFAMMATPERHVEKCVPDRYLEEAERKHGPSWPSEDERFIQYTRGLVDPPCFWGGVGPGCNAFDGCFVPEAP